MQNTIQIPFVTDKLKIKLTPLQALTHIAAWIPLIVMIIDAFTNNLTINPIQEATFRTGKTALWLLVLSLACTPINTLFGFRAVLKLRRPLGVYAFMYAAIHFSIYIGLDYFFNLQLIWIELSQKRYVIVGFAAFLILLPLAITSTKGWQKRMKRWWTHLHRLVYVAGILVAVHYTWVMKSDIREPLVWMGIIVLLLIMRIPIVRKKLSGIQAIKFGRKRAPARS
ncbi:MAG: sulfoxide reductase heme-binding subunit YedZ [Anaerolineales bacterium]|nr:sulfoxide reductase heme-binding subunit YedZ [Anaerolineales bacterium]